MEEKKSPQPHQTNTTPNTAPTPAPNVVPPQTNGMAIASLVLGIISILFCWIPFAAFGGQIVPILGFIFGILGMNKKYESGRGMAIAGIITSVIAFAVESIWVVLLIIGALSDSNL